MKIYQKPILIAIFPVLLFLCASDVKAEIVFDSTSSANTGSNTASNLTWSHTVSGSDRILIVGVSINGNTTVSTITYRGQNLTRLATATQGNQARISLWYLLNPPLGSGNVIVTMSAAVRLVAGATSYTGVSQTNPLGTPVINNSAGAIATLNVVSAVNELVIDVIARRGDLTTNPITAGSLQTQRWNIMTTVNNASTGITGGSSSKAGAAIVNMIWTWSSSRAWAIAGVSLKPALPPSDTTSPLRFNGTPSETLPSGTTQANISLFTNENAICRYSTLPGVSYGSILYIFQTTGGTSHSQPIFGLTDGSNYNFYIRCQDSAGNSNTDDFSINFSIAVPPSDTTPPTIPTNLSAVAVSKSQINLSWDESTDDIAVAGYRIFRDDNFISTLNDTSYADAGLSDSTAYSYTVSAFDEAGNESSQSDSAIAITFSPPPPPPPDDTTPPSVPENLSAVAVSKSQINLSWDESTDDIAVAGYRIFRDGELILSIVSTNYSDFGLNDSTLYHYAVSALDTSDNESALSLSVSATTFSPPPPPPPDDIIPPLRFNGLPSGVLPSGINQTTISLSTDENATCKYSILSETDYAAMDNIFEVTGLKEHSQEIFGLNDNVAYNFYVRCVDFSLNANNNDFLIDFSVAEATDTIWPTTPTNLTLISVSSDQVDFKWDVSTDNVGVLGYKIFRDGVQIASTDETHYSGIGVISGTTYAYTISSYDAAGNESSLSDPLVVTTLSTDTTAPTIFNLIVSNITTSSAAISWDTDEPSISEVQYGLTTGYSFSISSGDFQTIHTFLLESLSPNATYHYRVRSQDEAGNESLSTDNTFQTNTALDIMPPNQVTDLTITQITYSAVDLSWTAPSDDTGAQIFSYNLRYSTSPITEENWLSAFGVFGEPFPGVPGEGRKYTVVGLIPDTPYYFAVKSSDISGNVSQLSNIAFGRTPSKPQASATTGGGSGGITVVLSPPPSDFKAFPGDKQISLHWKNPIISYFVRVVIIRKIGEPSISRNDGEIIYEGDREEYTDTSLDNDTVYYYAIYSFDREMNYSVLIIVSSQPRIGITTQQTEKKEEFEETREEISEIEKETKKSEEPEFKFPTTIFSKSLYFGITNEDVGALQILLSQDPSLYLEGSITGYFGNFTKGAVQKFQCKYNIICSGDEITTGYGRVGPLTLAKLNELVKAGFYGEITSKKTKFFFKSLFAGIINDDVKRLQELLAKDTFIYPEGLVTGYFGPFTKSAVQRFQCKYNIVCEGSENTTGYGRVGPYTRAELNKIQIKSSSE